MTILTARNTAVAAVLLVAGAFGAVQLVARNNDKAPLKAAAPIASPSVFPKLEPAKNPTTLHLQADDRAVFGWVSGTKDFKGEKVTITLPGVTKNGENPTTQVVGKTVTVTVGEDNTFQWAYKVEAPTTVEFRLGELRGTVALAPAVARGGPSVFFVVDRTAYRPGQPLHFAGFLRKEDDAGEFAPMPKQEVTVQLVSQQKRTKAATIKLTSDERGRIAGSYVFADGDALDYYDLSVPGYKGAAKVLLGEYRKSKVRLKIGGEAKDGKMTLKFEPVDFLEKPVSTVGGTFTAQIVRKGTKEKPFTLKAEDFVNHEPRSNVFADVASLSEEDLLFQEAEGVSGLNFRGLGNAVVHQLNGAVPPAQEQAAEYSFDLKPEWRKGDCEIIVQGVITDTNGREQRATATVAIAEVVGDEKFAKPVVLDTKKSRFFTTETIEVQATGGAFANAGDTQATLLVMKLAFQTPSSPIIGFGDGYFGQLYSYRSRYRRPMPVDQNVATVETVRRTLVTAVPFKGGTASLNLSEPGAYKLIAVIPDSKGGSTQKETTVVVKRLDDVNAFVLNLDKEEYSQGEKLTGTIHCRFSDAMALLTIRDSSGVRVAKPITFVKGICKLDESLPGGLKYGCSVDVAYPEGDDAAQIAQTFVRVVPTDRIVKVEVNTPKDIPPGTAVKLDLQVDRNEPVDLVVSVYDQSLLGIAADKSIDIRNFYLADERANPQYSAAMLQRRIGAVTLGTLFAKIEKMLKDGEKEKDKKLTDSERAMLQNVLTNRKNRYLYSMDIATLLRVAGVDVYFSTMGGGTNYYWHFPDQNNVESAEKVQLRETFSPNKTNNNGQWMIETRFVGNTLVLHETHPSYVNNPYYSNAWHPVFGMNYGGGYGYGNFYGYNGAGFGGGGFNGAMLWQQNGIVNYSGRMARGDAAWSSGGNGFYSVTGNSVHSFMPEAQGFISHMPTSGPGGGPALINADAEQGHIMVRRDFSDSAFWNSGVRTDENGKASVTFKLPDSLTNWQVVVTAVSSKMHVGSAKASFRTFKPIMVWPMLPRTFTEGDTVDVFASVHNRTEVPQKIKVKLKVENGEIRTPEERTVEVPAKANVPVYWTFQAKSAGFTQLLMSADCTAGSDASLKRLPVVRSAAEQIVTASGKVKGEATIDLPEGFDPNAARLELTFAPTLAADMADTLNYLVEYPYGCVEQTMSRFLPAIKVAQILKQYKVNNPPLEAKLPGCVAGGIKRLLELQQPDGGWGWNGNGQTHEMMTPYALFGLLQAEKAGYTIPNETAISNGLNRLSNFITNMGDQQTSDRMYCLYVYSHRNELQPGWWQWIEQRVKAKGVSDYALALALEMAVQSKKTDLATQLARALKDRVKTANGHAYWETAGFSRWGDDKFEVTAAAMKALVAWDKDEPLIDNVLSFFIATKRGDRWNSTKDTAMILYAMTDFLAKSQYAAADSNTLGVSVNGKAQQVLKFDDQLTKKMTVAASELKAGKNTLKFDTKLTGVLYRAVFRYWKSGKDIPAMDKGIAVERNFYIVDAKGTTLRQIKNGDTVPRGSYIMSEVKAKHALPVNMRYVLVENPKPATGETVPADDGRFLTALADGCSPHVLREDREAMVCSHFEETAQAFKTRNVFLAELAGDFVVAPANVEMMYQTEVRGHSGTFAFKVEDKK